jgi:hypothetical protein
MNCQKRPYGCTFTNCTETFYSKFDWKRHETSQHYQHEAWICNEKINGALCSKMFFSADTARSHFANVHKITDDIAIERKLDAQHLGANNQSQFWCGFCEKILNLEQTGENAWAERFNHIGDHFEGRNGPRLQIMNWKAVDRDGEGVHPIVPSVPTKTQSPNEGDQESSDNSSPSPLDTLSRFFGSASTEERKGRLKRSRHGTPEVKTQCVRHTLHHSIQTVDLLIYGIVSS